MLQAVRGWFGGCMQAKKQRTAELMYTYEKLPIEGGGGTSREELLSVSENEPPSCEVGYY
jgi:hypothetical protein